MAPTIAAHPYAVDDRTNCQSEADRDDLATKANESVGEDGQHSESVHVCPRCDVINLAEFDLRAITLSYRPSLAGCAAERRSESVTELDSFTAPAPGLRSA